jgi:putative transposase
MGRRFGVLNIVDDVTRKCLRAVVGTSISGKRVVRGSIDLVAERGRPSMIVSNNATELTLNAVLSLPLANRRPWFRHQRLPTR